MFDDDDDDNDRMFASEIHSVLVVTPEMIRRQTGRKYWIPGAEAQESPKNKGEKIP